MIYAVIVIIGLIALMAAITIQAASEVKDLQIENDYLKEIIQQNEIQIGMLETQAMRDRVDRRIIDRRVSNHVAQEGVSDVSRYN